MKISKTGNRKPICQRKTKIENRGPLSQMIKKRRCSEIHKLKKDKI